MENEERKQTPLDPSDYAGEDIVVGKDPDGKLAFVKGMRRLASMVQVYGANVGVPITWEDGTPVSDETRRICVAYAKRQLRKEGVTVITNAVPE